MDVTDLIPAKYLGLAVAVLALLRAIDGLVRLIPDQYLSAHTTLQAVVIGAKKVFAWLFSAFKGKDTPPPTGPRALLALVLAGSLLTGCAHINPVVCGANRHLIAPDPVACTEAVISAIATLPGDIAACAVGGFSAACLDAVIASGKDLTPCLPTCAPDATGAGGGNPVHVAPNVLRQNMIDALRATGHESAGR